TSATITLQGAGFIEGNGSAYQFGSTVVQDSSVSAGPDVLDYNYYQNGLPYYVTTPNGYAIITVPLTAGAFGPITVTTAGGTSLPFSVNVTAITGTALSGTPANAALASANPGQAVSLTGSGLTTATGVILSYTDSGGTPQYVVLNPTTVSADGTTASLVIPAYANGIARLSVFGAANPLALQIVPTLTGFAISGGTLQLFGGGFVEAASTYRLPGATVTDTAVGSGPDVFNSYNAALGQYVDNAGVNIAEPQHGLGTATVTTAGGTSTPLALNVFNPGQGQLGDVAYDPASGKLWVADNNNPAKLDLVDPASGQIGRSITLTSGFGTPYLFGLAGLDVLPTAMSLGGTTVPAGSLLVFNGYPNPDQVTAVNPTTGAVLATLTLAGNYDLSAGTYDPVSGHLFVLDRRTNPTQVAEINPVTGAQINEFALPFNAGYAGLVADATGNLWYGSDQSADVVELSRTGAVQRRVTLSLQGVPGNTISGLSFDAAGNLVVASTQGQVFEVNLGYDPAVTLPVLTQVIGAAASGTPANAAVASANAGQVITLAGSNFGAGTQVQFQTLDNSGRAGVLARTPLAISADGTTLQVQVPDQATTGVIRVANVGASNLGFGSYNDAIYRRVTLSFTPGASSTALTFADGGLEGVNNESWGIDNVVVSQGGGTVFADNFETGGARPQWTQSAVDTSTAGVFSNFLGRFSSGSATLNLTGLTAGQSCTLTFDLYALDSLDGLSSSAGPDIFQVTDD
ncbi:MAG TPA: hypothetical protein VGD84_17455, partial [Pseudonocardiaceae bacterium]